MSDASSLAKESVKGLGAGAYLVTALPSVVLVLAVFALAASGLYPWDEPPDKVTAGAAAVVYTAQHLLLGGAAVLLLVVLVVAVLLRPFQVSMVQLLEGYWWNRGGGVTESLAVERHFRRMSRFRARKTPNERLAPSPTFADLATFDRRQRAVERMKARAAAGLEDYPRDPAALMPTLLGNVLRRAETTAGERYGLGTVVTYPRLYPHLSSRLDNEVSEQVDVLDTTATFTLLLWALAALASPLLLRVDPWSLTPVVLAALGGVTYRGARAAARRYGTLLATAYDLHRFDMLAALRLKLPEDVQEEMAGNKWLTTVLADDVILAEMAQLPPGWLYRHPQPVGGSGTSEASSPSSTSAGDGGASGGPPSPLAKAGDEGPTAKSVDASAADENNLTAETEHVHDNGE
jgi:hypothetical protein